MPMKDPFPNPADISRYAMTRSDTCGPYRDLCSNCDNGSECAGRTRPRRPIFYCEEFMVFGAAPRPEPDRPAQLRPREVRRANGRIGLCINCDNAATCLLPKPEGGIWHCEEYR